MNNKPPSGSELELDGGIFMGLDCLNGNLVNQKFGYINFETFTKFVDYPELKRFIRAILDVPDCRFRNTACSI